MEEYGITYEALAESIQHDQDHPPLYRDARGNEWNGEGDVPDWLRAAKNAGVSLDFFRIDPASQAAKPGSAPDSRGAGVPQMDLFA